MRVNRGLPPEAEGRRPPKPTYLVQTVDADGFYVNLHEVGDMKLAVKMAEQWSAENKVETRVCVGPSRQVIRTVNA